MRIARFTLGITLLVVTVLAAFPGSIRALGTRSSVWSPDEHIPGYFDDTFTPILVADRNKTVHAFASQWSNTEERRKVIVYRQWTLAGGWTRPVDILLSPIGNANLMGVYMDSVDTIHVIFTSTKALTGETFIYYSSAPAVNADWVPAWTLPTAVAANALDLNSGAISADEMGNLVIIFSGNQDGSGVYSLYSRNSGTNWSDPVAIFLTYDTKLSAFSLRLTGDGKHPIRAVWNVVTNLGADQYLYFANFDSQDLKWDPAVELDSRIDLPDYFGPSFPVMVDNGEEVVMVYNVGNPFSDRPVNPGRPIQRARISSDGGYMWSEPIDPFPLHVGRSGEHALVLDGNGTPYTLFIQRIENTDEAGNYSIVGGMWYSAYQNGVWSSPDRFVTTVAPHDVHAVVVQGNILLAVWRQDPGTGQSGIWYSYSVLDTTALPVVPLATAQVDYSLPELSETVSTGTVFSGPTPLPVLLDDAPASNLGSNPALPIIVGIIPVALVLFVVLFGSRFLKTNKTNQDEK